MAWRKRSGIMLCQPLDERNLARNYSMCPYMLAQPKLDGMRCWVQWQDGEPLLWSSEGNLITGVPHISLLLKDWAKACGKFQFDGELYTHGKAFEDIISTTKRGTDNLRDDFTDIQYHIFDMKHEGNNFLRLSELRGLFDAMPDSVRRADVFKLVETRAVARHNVDAQLERYIEAGYEGIILRNPLAEYVEKRPFTILKWKPSRSDTYKITYVHEAVSEKGTPLGRVGALECEDRFGNRFNVGPGLGITHEKAAELWRISDELIGKYAEVYYQNLTANAVPRFGKFNLIVDAREDDNETH